MVQRTVLKADISCQKCKKKFLKAVSSLEGVDTIEVDQGKGTLTVTGDADPYDIILRSRKTGKHVEVVSIGPPPAPPKKKPEVEKKPVEKKPDEKPPPCHDPCAWPQCQPVFLMPMQVGQCVEPDPSCSIM
ncbi:COPPER TRANSPORT PROTEIN FAMILY-RELATED [Salix koriyanagi]|uniref:COPPER TRANSPORT PROTEIN FAMILY-RELATED n=1 Tax=Salix koriyanagi TaxID=2511006 RepID=A0A9Q0ZFQ3_9ROSI|nr:COPPER TRANSPORT PROTEIN FAMILY-RELATED [Salix koriyanagi]